MKRLDLAPTEENLLESIRDDVTGRNQDIVDFIKLLDNTDGPFTYTIDAAWGDGKTFFVKSVCLLLESLNSRLGSEGQNHPELEEIREKLGDDDISILPFYFNAWENDFAEDPIMALFACMAANFDGGGLPQSQDIKKAIVPIIDAALALSPIPIKIADIDESFTTDSLIGAFKSKAEIRSRINTLFEDAIPRTANKLVIFIDELDRCRPDFAVHLLEQTKSLFTSKNVIVVFSADLDQLAKAVGGAYGAGFDTTRFLERFFDERITMQQVDGYAFTHDGLPLSPSNKFDALVSEIISKKVFTIRDAWRIKEKLDLAKEYALNSKHVHPSEAFASCTVLPLLVFIEHEDTALFRAITNGNDFDAVYSYGKQYPSFINNVREAIIRSRIDVPEKDRDEFSETDCSIYMHKLCVLIYGSQASVEYREALDQLGDFSRTAIARNVYGQLKFT